MESTDIVIVGAGISGLTAAREFRKRAPDLKLKILEAKNRVGGRTQTLTLRTATATDQWDIGGQWVGSTQTYLLDLLKELDIDTYPQFVDGKKCGQFGNAQIRHYDTSLPIEAVLKLYGPIEAVDIVRWIHNILSAEKEIDVENPFSSPKAAEWDSMTVEEHVKRHSWTNTVLDTANIASCAAFGQRVSRLSFLYFLLYGKAAGSCLDLLEATGTGAQGFKIKNGAQQISQRLASDLGIDGVQLNRAVFKIERDDSGVVVWSNSPTGDDPNVEKIRCKHLILAIPPQQASRIVFYPPLPADKHQLINGFPMGNLFKFLVTYPKAFWREKGFSGEIAATGYTGNAESINPVLVTYDSTTAHGNPAIVGFMNLEWSSETESARRDAVLKDLARYFGPEALHYLDYVDKSWAEEPYTGGCPVGCLPPGNMENYIRIREPTGRIHWSGTETATHWPGYMSGAVQSGLRVACEVLHEMAPQSVSAEDLEGSVYAKNYKKPLMIDRSYAKSSKCCSGTLKSVLILGCAVLTCVYVAKRYDCCKLDFSKIRSKLGGFL